MTQGKPGSARGGAQVRRMRRTQAHAATTARMDSPSRPGDFFAAPDEDDSELPIPDENASGCAPSDALYRVWPLVPETPAAVEPGGVRAWALSRPAPPTAWLAPPVPLRAPAPRRPCAPPPSRSPAAE